MVNNYSNTIIGVISMYNFKLIKTIKYLIKTKLNSRKENDIFMKDSGQFLIKLCKMSNKIMSDLFNTNCKKIYHYTSQDTLLKILDGKLRFTDRFYLNDKTEGIYTLDLIISEIDDIIAVDSKFYTIKNDIAQKCIEFKEELKNDRFNVYQCSFSLNNDSLPMWNYYTKNNELRGVNIGFDSKKLSDSIERTIPRAETVDKNQLFVFGGNVIYEKDKQKVIIKDIIEKYSQLIFEHYDCEKALRMSLHFFDRIIDRIVLAGTFFKKECFSVEEEYRLAVCLCAENGKFIALKDAKIEYMSKFNFYLPYIDLQYELNSIDSIMVSPTYDFNIIQHNLIALLKNYDISNEIEISQSSIPVRY